MKNWGLIKPVPNREQIKKMYEQQKGAFKEFRTSYQDKMQVTKDEFLKTKKEMKQHYLDKKKGIEKSVKETSSEFAEGVKSATYEWKLIGGWFVKNLKEFRIPFGSKK